MNFLEAMILLGVCFLPGVYVMAWVLHHLGVRKFFEEDEKTQIKPH